MLPASHRLRHSKDFEAVLRSGRKRRGRYVSVHILQQQSTPGKSPRVGFVVSKAVGNAPQRNRVKRRLRAIMAKQIPRIPGTADVVVRSFPSARLVDFEELHIEISELLEHLR